MKKPNGRQKPAKIPTKGEKNNWDSSTRKRAKREFWSDFKNFLITDYLLNIGGSLSILFYSVFIAGHKKV